MSGGNGGGRPPALGTQVYQQRTGGVCFHQLGVGAESMDSEPDSPRKWQSLGSNAAEKYNSCGAWVLRPKTVSGGGV